MPQPTVFRISLVEMISATEKKKSTPTPFCEIRAFIFLEKLLPQMQMAALKNMLKRNIEKVKTDFLPHIFFTDKNEYDGRELHQVTDFTLGDVNRRARVIIEGYEVQEIDIDEIVDAHFKQSRKEYGRQLPIKTDIIYKYVAFYTDDGMISREYDNWDIEMETQVVQVGRQREADLYKRANVLLDEIDRRTTELEGILKELKRIM